MIESLDAISVPREQCRALVEQNYLEKLRVSTSEGFDCMAYLFDIQTHDTSLQKYAEMVEATIDLDQLDAHRYVIKPDYNPRLRAHADQIIAVRSLYH